MEKYTKIKPIYFVIYDSYLKRRRFVLILQFFFQHFSSSSSSLLPNTLKNMRWSYNTLQQNTKTRLYLCFYSAYVN